MIVEIKWDRLTFYISILEYFGYWNRDFIFQNFIKLLKKDLVLDIYFAALHANFGFLYFINTHEVY